VDHRRKGGDIVYLTSNVVELGILLFFCRQIVFVKMM
jgi:hypothetical protein